MALLERTFLPFTKGRRSGALFCGPSAASTGDGDRGIGYAGRPAARWPKAPAGLSRHFAHCVYGFPQLVDDLAELLVVAGEVLAARTNGARVGVQCIQVLHHLVH